MFLTVLSSHPGSYDGIVWIVGGMALFTALMLAGWLKSKSRQSPPTRKPSGHQ